MTEDLVLRDYRESDQEQIFSLMQEIYDDAVMANSRRHWSWQYHDNPRNPDGRVAIRVVERGGEIVAIICGIRQHFWIDGRVVPGQWTVDFMARRAGTNQKERLRYGQRLAFELRDTQPLVAGVNRPALNRYWKRVLGDRVDICAVPMMIRPLRADAIARRKLKSTALARAAGVAGRVALPFVFRDRARRSGALRIEPLERFGAGADALWEDAAPTFTNLAVRDGAYLDWRYVEAPDRRYDRLGAFDGERLAGWVVTRCFEGEGLKKGRIVDAFASAGETETWEAVLGAAVDHLRAEGCDLLHGLGTTVEPIMAAYRACGFRANPDHAKEAQYIAYTNIESIDANAFYNGDNWHVSLGDADTDFSTPE